MRRKYQSLRYIHAQQAYNCTQKQLGLGYGCGFPNKHDIQTQKPIETQDPNPNSDPKTYRNQRPKPKPRPPNFMGYLKFFFKFFNYNL